MNTAQQTARVGLFFLLGVALVWVTFETLSDGKLFEERGHTLIAGFDDLRQLKTGDEVRMAGVKVGSVKTTRLAGRRAEAVLAGRPQGPIANDATATIVMAGLIGGNYISIDMGSPGAPPLPTAPRSRPTISPDLNTHHGGARRPRQAAPGLARLLQQGAQRRRQGRGRHHPEARQARDGELRRGSTPR